MTDRLDKNSHQVVMYRLAFLSLSWGERSLVPESLLCLDAQIHVANLHKLGQHIGTNSVELRY